MKAKAKKTARTPAARKPAKRKPVPQLTVQDFDWGCIYSGTKRQLLTSGLADAEQIHANDFKGITVYRSKDVSRSMLRKARLTRMAADKWEFAVAYGANEYNPTERIKRVCSILVEDHANTVATLRAVLTLPPLSDILKIKARKEEKSHG